MLLTRLVVALVASHENALIDMDLFVGGQGGYSCYRLPNLLQMRTPGHLVAVAQGHKNGCADSGRMDALVRTSKDNGATWSDMALVTPKSVLGKTMGTPTAIVDLTTDTIFLFLCVDFTQILLLTSTDGAMTWEEPRDLTSTLFPPTWVRS
jgi:sialidase-1